MVYRGPQPTSYYSGTVAVLPIHITGSLVLHTPASPVSPFDDSLRALIADMVDTMRAAPGVGLAAPQVGYGLQLFVWEYDDGETLSRGHVLNPRLRVSGRKEHAVFGEPDEEGCLSIPGQRAPLARWSQATLSGTDIDGQPVIITATDWLARIFQHEFDHLQGILYRDRLKKREQVILDEAIDQAGWGNEGQTWTPGPDSRELDFATDDA